MQATNREQVVLSLAEQGFGYVMSGVPFFALKLLLKHPSVGSADHSVIPPATGSFFSKHALTLFGGHTKSVPNRHAVTGVLCSWAATSDTQSAREPRSKDRSLLSDPKRERPDGLPSFYVHGESCMCPLYITCSPLPTEQQSAKKSRKNYAKGDHP